MKYLKKLAISFVAANVVLAVFNAMLDWYARFLNDPNPIMAYASVALLTLMFMLQMCKEEGK